MNIHIEEYNSSYENKWDEFVMGESVNGTFLQTRNFLNYHGNNKFQDASLLLMNGSNIIGVIPAHSKDDDGVMSFCSHGGSTFGGIILSGSSYNVSYIEALMPELEEYLKTKGYKSALLKMTSDLFSKKSMGLLDYSLFRFGFDQYDELSFYIDCNSIEDGDLSFMSSSRRRDYRYSLKNDFRIERIEQDRDIKVFYEILRENLNKFNTTPVHTESELIDFKNNRLNDIVRFYGVFEGEQMVAGSMLFDFDSKVLHTQYLACLPEYNKKFAMNFMDYNLIMIAKIENFKFFSFGTSTGNHGKDLNVGLALYKEGFGCEYSVNRTYYKSYE